MWIDSILDCIDCRMIFISRYASVYVSLSFFVIQMKNNGINNWLTIPSVDLTGTKAWIINICWYLVDEGRNVPSIWRKEFFGKHHLSKPIMIIVLDWWRNQSSDFLPLPRNWVKSFGISGKLSDSSSFSCAFLYFNLQLFTKRRKFTSWEFRFANPNYFPIRTGRGNVW